MKKIYLILCAVIFSAVAMAQTEYDALRMSQTDLHGTARYVSMGGAFGALGGDASALRDNPAGLAVYRSGEITTTLSGSKSISNALWYDDERISESKLGVQFNNFAYVVAGARNNDYSPLKFSNISFSYTRLKSFNRSMSATGISNASFTDFLGGFTWGFDEDALRTTKDYDPFFNKNMPWLSALAYEGFLIDLIPGETTQWESAYIGKALSESTLYESGGVNEYAFGWGGNFNNNLFVGVNLSILDLDYSLRGLLSEKFSTDQGSFQLRNYLSQSGIGVNMKFGAIYMPTNSLRLGAAFHTPTVYTMSELSEATLSSRNKNFDDAALNFEARTNLKTPDGGATQSFHLQTPLQVQLSAAYLFGKKGLISAEYNFVNYTGMRFSDEDGQMDSFRLENLGEIVNGKQVGGMSDVLRNGHVLKVGGEFKPLPTFALRAGYALHTGATNPKYEEGKMIRLETRNTNTEYFEQEAAHYFTAGLGVREAGWFLDFAYSLRTQKENFYPYQFNREDLKPAEINTNNHNLVVTLGLKL
ncbi:MAG TPA: hypothetical protein GXZ87_01535 [Bacteroidales bacterium]|nr:hypothetical protein [Bacteroidales bacterium]